MRKTLLGFRSPLAAMLATFVREKWACGYKYRNAVDWLRQLDRMWLAPNALKPELSREWCVSFIRLRPGESPGSQAYRTAVWRELARHARRGGLEAYLPGPAVTQIRPPTYVPFIYTRTQLGALFAAADRASVHNRFARCPRVMGLLLRLLYGTGLRIGEALGLTVGDYDSAKNMLTIRQGKNERDRLIPLAPALDKRMKEYLHRFPSDANTPIFSSLRGHLAISRSTVGMHFRKLLPKAGLPPRAHGSGPRIHDLRHTFAVHRLENWYLAGEDVMARLPILSVYMGHRHLRETYYYLRITASFFPEISRRLKAYAGDVIPKEVDHEAH